MANTGTWLLGLTLIVVITLVILLILVQPAPLVPICPSGQHYLPSSNSCVNNCSTPCNSPQVCSDTGKCVQPCGPGNPCPSGQYCNSVNGFCYPNCKSDTDCSGTGICVSGTCIYGYFPNPPLSNNVVNYVYPNSSTFVPLWPKGSLPVAFFFDVGICTFRQIYNQGNDNTSPTFYINRLGTYNVKISFTYSNGNDFNYSLRRTTYKIPGNEVPSSCSTYGDLTQYTPVGSDMLEDQGSITRIFPTTVDQNYITYIIVFMYGGQGTWDGKFPTIGPITLQIQPVSS